MKKLKNIQLYESFGNRDISKFTDRQTGGFFTMEDIKEFENITGGDYSREEILDILELTKHSVEILNHLINEPDRIVGERSRKKAMEVVKDHPMILDYVQKNML